MSTEKRMYLVLLGAPGAGKGTQARLLEEKLGLPQISTGDLFRHHFTHQTDLGRRAKAYMDRGDLVPDEVTIQMVADRLQEPDTRNGAIMDGFPRNLVQAAAFDEMTAPHGGVSLAPLINLEDDEAMRRITGRRVCRSCGSVFHVDFNPPRTPGVCDVDGGVLYQRDDDKPDTVRNRLFVYYKQTSPLIGYYFAKSLLVTVDGARPISEVHEALMHVIVG